MADTWSSHITPFAVVVNWSLELWFVALASNKVSTFFQFEKSDAEPLQDQLLA